MKALVFDSGPIINLALNNLLWILKPLKEKFKGEFYITESVKRECVDRPLTSKKFKYEALETLKTLEDETLKVYKNRELKNKTLDLLRLSNTLFKVHGNYIKNVQYAEVEALVASQMLNANAVVIDEFVTRMIIENHKAVRERMEHKLHQHVDIDRDNIEKFESSIKNIKVVRSLELVTIAYEFDLFKHLYLKIENPKKTLLDGVLWAIKLNGCSMTEKEISEVMKIQGF